MDHIITLEQLAARIEEIGQINRIKPRSKEWIKMEYFMVQGAMATGVEIQPIIMLFVMSGRSLTEEARRINEKIPTIS